MIDYIVRGGAGHSDTIISSEGQEMGNIHPLHNMSFKLDSKASESWKLDPRVHGEIRPFSMRVTSYPSDEPVLTIRSHLFFHHGKAYLMTGIPEEVNPADHTLGKRHISRLDSFPFTSLEEVDPETWGRLKRHRGLSVGTIDGIGLDEFRVVLSDELKEVGLPLAACSYLLYTTSRGGR